MTTLQPPPDPDAPGSAPSHETALWAGLVAFFASLLAIGIFDILDPDKLWEYLGALIVAFITGGGVYAKQRLDDAKRAEAGLTFIEVVVVCLVIAVVVLLVVTFD